MKSKSEFEFEEEAQDDEERDDLDSPDPREEYSEGKIDMNGATPPQRW